jgi:hypothetical protein
VRLTVDPVDRAELAEADHGHSRYVTATREPVRDSARVRVTLCAGPVAGPPAEPPSSSQLPLPAASMRRRADLFPRPRDERPGPRVRHPWSAQWERN